ncbi:DUF5625 family protein [Pseudomonas sp. MDT1-85]
MLLVIEKKELAVHGVINILRKWAIALLCVLLVACADPLWIVKPMDVSRDNQQVSMDFVVKRVGEYRFALLFVRGKNLVEMNRQSEMWGESGGKGISIPVHVRIFRDGKIFSDENISTNGVFWGQNFEYQGSTLNTAVRLIKTYELPAGAYSVLVNTLEDVEAFRGVESYIEFAYYKPKH